ncbi:hypothetical protein KUTeg_009212 [Tegillarca granosa]|uniref:Uncharacterized protein n=1 Tax=Tegillarca granosa TaxID=220873 RepID=A0ABQ9F778_TEGGR|nr:hypothetical protein KUTeg_009212 [Tegillarca granosa]
MFYLLLIAEINKENRTINRRQYFCFDIPASLQDNMLRDLHLSETEYMAFYSYFSWPNVIMCFVGGYLTDRFFGIRVGTVIFCCLVIIGQNKFF